MNEREYAYASIRELGRMLRSGEATPTLLVDYFLNRLDTIGRHLNAVVRLTAERAYREARLAEAELKAGYDRGPLHGIPYGAKDLLATAGIPTSWGAEPLRDQVFTEDASALKRLREAGAVLVAKLAMVELAGGMGYNQPNASLTGPGINPWNTTAWSGGSSSGSGSAVGSGCIPFALGSETWGSILTPASYCGVSGLRPTYGRVSRHGAMALSWTLDKIGPLARSADDCGLVLAAIAGPDPADSTSLNQTYSYDSTTGRTRSFRLGVLRDRLDQMQVAVRDNFLSSLEVLSASSQLFDISLPDLPFEAATTILLRSEASAAMEDLIESGVLLGLTAPEDRAGGYAGMVIPAVDYIRAMRVRRLADRALDALFGDYDAVLYPTTALVASPLDVTFETYDGSLRRLPLSSAGNLAGLPAIGIPNGFGERGLPTSLQIVGRAGSENQLLAVARAFQRSTHWHQERPPVDFGPTVTAP